MRNTEVSRRLVSAFVALAVLVPAGPGLAQEQAGGDAAAQANNPLANMTALNFQDYFIGELTESDRAANQFWVRFAKPFKLVGGDWLMRASLPVPTQPTPPDGDTKTGLGDLNVFASYLFKTKDPALSVGLGPQITIPTATSDYLGSQKWSAGFAHVLFNAKSLKLQWGYLLTWQHSFAGSDDRATVNTGAFQPFAMYQIGNHFYLRSAPIWVYNFETDGYTIPLGLGIGKVIPKGRTVYNIFVEPQFSVADDGAGWAEWQIFVGFNMQFIG